MTAEDDAYVHNLRDAFERYLTAVVRPLLHQNRDLKTSLQAERRQTGGGVRRELAILEPLRKDADCALYFGIPVCDMTRDELLLTVLAIGQNCGNASMITRNEELHG